VRPTGECSAKKVGSHWEIEIKGADEPNRATVSLDSNFKLIAVTKNPVAPQPLTGRIPAN